jgi:hypothetical protein
MVDARNSRNVSRRICAASGPPEPDSNHRCHRQGTYQQPGTERRV